MVEDYKNKSLELIVREIDGVVYTEQWRTINDFPKYSISSFGRYRRNQRVCSLRKRIIPSKILSIRINQKGYAVAMFRGYDKKRAFVHRLVGFAFIPLIESKNCINHKTGIKTDNHFSQLEWCTPQENNDHAVMMGLAKRGKKPYVNTYIKKGIPEGRKPIINIETRETYLHLKDLKNKVPGIDAKRVRRGMNGERYNNTPYRYIGKEDISKKKPELKENPFAVFDMNGNYVTEFKYSKDLLNFLNQKDIRTVNRFMKGRCQYIKGYKFKRIRCDGTYEEPIPFMSKKPPLKPKRIKNPLQPTKTVKQYDTQGNIIANFPSIREAAMFMGKDKKDFRHIVIKSPRNYYKGFIWKIQ